MRKKIKQLMNKEEGFTLVELLAVIVILGIILAIAIPSISGVIDRANDDADTAEQALIVDAARLYFTSKNMEGDADVDVSVLISEGYLETRDLSEGADVPNGNVSRTKSTTDGDKSYTYKYNAPATTGGEG